MRIAIAQAYNGVHAIYEKELSKLKVKFFLFNIDCQNWLSVESKKPTVYLWHADSKEERYREIYDKIYFIENILGKPVFPDMNMYFAQGDKVKQYQILKYLNITTPKTYFTTNKIIAFKLIQKIKYPFVLKDPYGYGGHHVFKIKNKAEATKYLNKIFGAGLKVHHSTCKDIFYAQEFIKVEKDLRVIVIGNKVFCAYWRQGQVTNWRHNLDQGAQSDFKNIPPVALALCKKVSNRMNYHWMAYDLLITPNNKVMINEFSCNFSVVGATQGGFNVRQAQMEYIKKKYF